MKDNEAPDFKETILARYTGQYVTASELNATERKTSEQIKMELRPIANFSTNEIAEYLIAKGYTVGFEDTTVVWLMRKNPRYEIENP